jgi:uncharacterized protein (DUF1330 family)
MAAYLVVEINAISDEAALGEYIGHVVPLVEARGGRYLARGPAQTLEGDAHPILLVIVEFPSMDALTEFVASPDYAPLKAIRQRSSAMNFLAVESL